MLNPNELDAAEIRAERLRASAPDFRERIENDIFAPGDPYDFVGYALAHPHAGELLLLGAWTADPCLNIRRGEPEETRWLRKDVLSDCAKALIRDFLALRTEQALERWIESDGRDW